MNVLIVGATGATGKDLLELMLQDKSIDRIDVFVRSDLNMRSPKLNVHLIDFDRPELWRHKLKGDVLFSCFGTTLKAAGSKAAQFKVDYGYQFEFAKAAKENQVGSYVLVSSDHASTKSPFFYTKMKGQLEEDVKKLKFTKLIIFNPPLLLRKDSDRKAEIMAGKILRFFNALGLLTAYKPLSTDLLAKAMLVSIKKLNNGEHSIKAQDIRKLISS